MCCGEADLRKWSFHCYCGPMFPWKWTVRSEWKIAPWQLGRSSFIGFVSSNPAITSEIIKYRLFHYFPRYLKSSVQLDIFDEFHLNENIFVTQSNNQCLLGSECVRAVGLNKKRNFCSFLHSCLIKTKWKDCLIRSTRRRGEVVASGKWITVGLNDDASILTETRSPAIWSNLRTSNVGTAL